MGLATIQTVVSDHGGHLSVEAMPGAGTAFRMEFPVAPALVKPPQSESSAKKSKPKKEPEHVEAEASAVAVKRKPSLARMMDI